jgi:hypothetical protein
MRCIIARELWYGLAKRCINTKAIWLRRLKRLLVMKEEGRFVEGWMNGRVRGKEGKNRGAESGR